jgi:hypothetical protein
MAQNQLDIEISFREEAPQELRSVLEEVGASEIKAVPQRGIVEVGWLFLGVLTLKALVGLVAKILKLWNCGVVVDTRGPKVLVEKNCELPRGTVLVISKNGTQSKLHEPADQELDDLIEASGVGSQ